MSTQLLSVRGLQVDFATRHRRVPALAGLDLDVGAGEIVGIIGESGSGKSVAALAVMGLLDPAAMIGGGQVLYRGRDLLTLGAAERASWRGAEGAMIFQNPRAALNPVRRVGDQLGDVIARRSAAGRAGVRRRVLELLREMRIPDPERRRTAFPHELSGGMCQRIGIAIALAAAPRLLIADEPTTGLDVTTQAGILELIRSLAREKGMAVALVLHDLALAAEYCDRIVVMQAGRAVETAASDRLLAHPAHPASRRLLDARALWPGSGPTAAVGPDGAAPGRAGSGSAGPGGARSGLPEPEGTGTGPDGSAGLRQDRPAREENDPGGGSGDASGSGAAGTGAPDRASCAEAPPLLELRGVRLYFALPRARPFGRRPMLHAVDGVDLQIRPGEAVGLVGESGCGKSTLARLVARLLDPGQGEIRLDGQQIGSVPAARFAGASARRDIQMVFQDPDGSLNPRLPAFEAIADPARRLLPRLDRTALHLEVVAAAGAAGLPQELLGRLPHQLSGGQKARVGIARALVVRPRLLVLDEPLAALDLPVQAMVLRRLERLRRARGIALLFISHDLGAVRRLCSRVLVMYLGQLVETGPADAVCGAPGHPYTRALLSAAPAGSGPRPERIRLDGEPQSPVDPPGTLCRLAGRCPFEMPRCRSEMPLLRRIAPGRELRCHLDPGGQ